MFFEVRMTRHTSIGTFRPAVIYMIKPEDEKRLNAMKKLLKADKKRPEEDRVYSVMTEEQARARKTKMRELAVKQSKAELPVEMRATAMADAIDLAEIVKEQAEELAIMKVEATQSAGLLETQAEEIQTLTAKQADDASSIQSLTEIQSDLTAKVQSQAADLIASSEQNYELKAEIVELKKSAEANSKTAAKKAEKPEQKA